MNMRPPALDLPIMFIDVRITAGAMAILDGVTLTISPGLPTVLIGPNGAGKTTLLRAAMGLVPASSGLITWGGRELSDPRHRAIMFQRPAMLRRSAGGNVRYALAAAGLPRGKRHERAVALLAEVGLAGLIAVRPGACQAASSNGSRWPARSRATPASCSSMSQPPVSTQSNKIDRGHRARSERARRQGRDVDA